MRLARYFFVFTVLWINPTSDLLANDLSVQTGQELWNSKFYKQRQCSNCHQKNLSLSGQHLKTKKVIKPMAYSANPERYKNKKKTEKWFKRNCKWTWGRECTASEKDHILQFLLSL